MESKSFTYLISNEKRLSYNIRVNIMMLKPFFFFSYCIQVNNFIVECVKGFMDCRFVQNVVFTYRRVLSFSLPFWSNNYSIVYIGYQLLFDGQWACLSH